MKKETIARELYKESTTKRKKKKFKEPLYRKIRFANKDIEIKVYFKGGQFVAEWELYPTSVYGTGVKIAHALDEVAAQLEAFIGRCSESIAAGIPLIKDMQDAYNYITKEDNHG
jgi:hypothetical protein